MHDRTQMEASERQRMQQIMDAARDSLVSAGFTSIVIIASWQTEDGHTALIPACAGDWYAQNGMMRHLLVMREENARIEERQRLESNEDD